MHMYLSADGRYYHGPSPMDGYVFVEVEVAERFHQAWVQRYLKAPEHLKPTMEALHTSANFWDLAVLEGAHTIQQYLQIEFLIPHSYRVHAIDHGHPLWDYAVQEELLQQWRPSVSCLIQTSSDPLCGIYSLPKGTHSPLWNNIPNKGTPQT